MTNDRFTQPAIVSVRTHFATDKLKELRRDSRMHFMNAEGTAFADRFPSIDKLLGDA